MIEVLSEPQFLRVSCRETLRRFVEPADVRIEAEISTLEYAVQLNRMGALPKPAQLEHQPQVPMCALRIWPSG